MTYEYWVALKYNKISDENSNVELENQVQEVFDFLKKSFVVYKNGRNIFVINMTSTVNRNLASSHLKKEFVSKFRNKKFNFLNCFNSCNYDLNEDSVTAASRLEKRLLRGIEENNQTVISFGLAIQEVLNIREMLKQNFSINLSCGISYTEEIAVYVSDRHGNNSITIMLPEEFENVYGIIEIGKFKQIKKSIRNDLTSRFNVRTLNDILTIKYSQFCFHFPTNIVENVLDAVRGNPYKNKKSKCLQIISKYYGESPVDTYNDVKKILEEVASDFEKEINIRKCTRNLVPKKFYLKFGSKPDRLTKHYINAPLDDMIKCLINNSFKKFKTLVREEDLELLKLVYFELGGEKLEDISLNTPITKFFKPNSKPFTSTKISKKRTIMTKEEEIDSMNNLFENNEQNKRRKTSNESIIIIE